MGDFVADIFLRALHERSRVDMRRQRERACRDHVSERRLPGPSRSYDADQPRIQGHSPGSEPRRARYLHARDHIRGHRSGRRVYRHDHSVFGFHADLPKRLEPKIALNPGVPLVIGCANTLQRVGITSMKAGLKSAVCLHDLVRPRNLRPAQPVIPRLGDDANMMCAAASIFCRSAASEASFCNPAVPSARPVATAIRAFCWIHSLASIARRSCRTRS